MTQTVSSTVGLKWLAGRLVVGADSGGRSIAMGQWPSKDPPWQGMKPSDLLLLAAAACAAYDVVEILEKQREPLAGLEVTCTGEQMAEAPYAFTRIHMHFMVTGDLSPRKVERAIDLSLTKYCSVVNTLRAAVQITVDHALTS